MAFIQKIVAIAKKPALIVAMVLSVYFYFGLSHIGKFETADEHYWVYSPDNGRIWQYWNAIKTKNWAATYINDKPGVTLALISGPTLLFEKEHNSINEYERQIERTSRNDSKVSAHVFALFRVPLVLFNGVFSLFFLWAIKKITKNKWLALWAWMFVLLSPVLIGISQIVNPDALLWSFVTAAILSFYIFLESRQRKHAAMTAGFFGFALLTKYSSLILLPFFFMSAVAYLWFHFDELRKEFHKIYVRFIVYIVTITIGAFWIFVLFVPGIFWQFSVFLHGVRMLHDKNIILFILAGLLSIVFVDICFFRSRIASKIAEVLQLMKRYLPNILYGIFFVLALVVLITWMGSKGVMFPKIYSFQHDIERGVAFTKINNFLQLLLELRSVLFSLTPIVLFGSLVLIFKGMLGKMKFPFFSLYLFVFLVSFYGAMIQQDLLVTYRYGIMAYPLFAILAALGIFEIFSSATYKFMLSLGLLVFSFVSIWSVKPFYFNYQNSLINREQTIADAWGMGGYEAAQYLNSLPNAKDLKVWADYRGFCAFFNGTCIRERNEDGAYDSTVDYFIKTRRGSIIFNSRWSNLKENYLDNSGNLTPVWQMDINGNDGNFVQVFKSKNTL